MADPRAKREGGVTIAPGDSPRKTRLLLGAAALLAVAAVFVLARAPEPEDAPPRDAAPDLTSQPAPPPAPPEAPPSAVPELAAPEVAAAPPLEPPPPASEPEPANPTPAPEEGEAGAAVPSGIGVFPPPGTEPVKSGIAVPEDFELPEGYLRHYQATDDGQPVDPILLVHPDYELLDDQGNPVSLPDGVVPPELAPPGMPIERVDPPEPLDESDP